MGKIQWWYPTKLRCLKIRIRQYYDQHIVQHSLPWLVSKLFLVTASINDFIFRYHYRLSHLRYWNERRRRVLGRFRWSTNSSTGRRVSPNWCRELWFGFRLRTRMAISVCPRHILSQLAQPKLGGLVKFITPDNDWKITKNEYLKRQQINHCYLKKIRYW